MRVYEVNDNGHIYKLVLRKTNYWNGNNIALALYTYPDYEPFCNLSVNLTLKNSKEYAYIDVNNCPFAEKFIKENGIGEFTGIYEKSGYCKYPLYKIYINKKELFFEYEV